MFAFSIQTLLASVVFYIGILESAGTLADIQFTGGDAPCTISGATQIRCDSTTPVTVSWTGTAGYTLSGDLTVYPGYDGYAWVLADDTRTTAILDTLSADTATPEIIRSLYVRTGHSEPPEPSLAMVQHITRLAQHQDPLIRMAAADAAHPWFAGTKLDRMPVDSPPLLTEKLLWHFARDPHKGVRKRVLHMLRDLRPPYSRGAAESILRRLARDPVPSVRRAATATLKRAHQVGVVTPEEAWTQALKMVSQEGPPGRTAANTLAHLSRWVEPNQEIVPEAALKKTLRYHPERVWRLWTAWRKHVPLREDWGLELLTRTVGLSEPLLKHWAKTDPKGLHRILHQWEPRFPHTARWEQIGVWFERIEDRDLRITLGLPPNPPAKVKKKVKVKINLKDKPAARP